MLGREKETREKRTNVRERNKQIKRRKNVSYRKKKINLQSKTHKRGKERKRTSNDGIAGIGSFIWF